MRTLSQKSRLLHVPSRLPPDPVIPHKDPAGLMIHLRRNPNRADHGRWNRRTTDCVSPTNSGRCDNSPGPRDTLSGFGKTASEPTWLREHNTTRNVIRKAIAMMAHTPSFHPSDRIDFLEPQSTTASDVLQLVHNELDAEPVTAPPDGHPCWHTLTECGTELWLDTGDVAAIQPLWNRNFSGLTTNNSLLNSEVQKGTYDELVPEADRILTKLPMDQRIREIAFVLNARHALRLVEQFGCRVSVELHTDVANDWTASVGYAHRYHEVCPDHFVIKIPFTPGGLIATRKLRSEGIPVNLTLGFSARQNYVATALANPSYVNVFLGRLNAYVADNGLGDGQMVGEKATIASQHEVNVFARGLPQSETRQIAASLRDAGQLERLVGVNVFTMPPNVVQQAQQESMGGWKSCLEEDYAVSLSPGVSDTSVRWDKLWSVSADERKYVEQMILHSPQSADDLIDASGDHGAADLFPQLSQEDSMTIAKDGKIPRHERWAERIMAREVAIDSLMTLAGLAHFAASQSELDARIRDHIA